MKTCSVQTCRTSFGSASAGSRGVPHRRFSLHEGPASCIPASGWGIFSSPIHHCLPQSYVPKDLRSAGYVFVRHDAHRSPLQLPCVGPFQVFKVGPKTFRVDMRGCCEEVSMDCLKPAHVFPDEPGPTPPKLSSPGTQVLTTASGANCGLSFLAGPIKETFRGRCPGSRYTQWVCLGH